MVKRKWRGKRQSKKTEKLAEDSQFKEKPRAPLQTDTQPVEPLKTTQRTTTRFYAYKETPI